MPNSRVRPNARNAGVCDRPSRPNDSQVLAAPTHTASHALASCGASLLPGGVVDALGEFRRGDMIEVRVDGEGGASCVARGISQYSALDLRRIGRRHTRDIEAIHGYTYGDNVIHRDDLVLLP